MNFVTNLEFALHFALCRVPQIILNVYTPEAHMLKGYNVNLRKT